MTERRTWTEDDDETLRNAAKAGLFSSDVATMLGRTRQSVLHRAKRIGLQWHADDGDTAAKHVALGRAGGLRKEARRRARKLQVELLAKQGKSAREIAAIMGLAQRTIYDLAPGGIMASPRRAPLTDEMLAAFANGAPWPTIAGIGGVTVKAARLRIKTHATPEHRVQRDMILLQVKQAEQADRLAAIAQAKAEREAKEAERAAAKKAPPRKKINFNRIGQPKQTDTKPVGTYTAAAQFLGRWYRPVFRAAIADRRADPDDYQVGRVRMPALEMLDLARSKGFAA